MNKQEHHEPSIGICYIKDGVPSGERKPADYKLLILIRVYLCGFVSGLMVGF